MNYYQLLKINKFIDSPHIKMLGIAVLYLLRKRYFAIFMDPVNGCNLRCQICYFSDPNYQPNKKPPISIDDLKLIAISFFPYALRLQIGCGTEPTLYKHNSEIIKLAKKSGINQVSFTTNANLLTRENIRDLLMSGLDEIIISMHGVYCETYETLMRGASYEKFHQVLVFINEERKVYPNFKLRINYTINQDNLFELSHFFEIMGRYNIDVLQLRPLRKLGETAYDKFDLLALEKEYSRIILELKNECKNRRITCLTTPDLKSKETNKGADITQFTYCYISPKEYGNSDFNIQKESWREFCKRTKFLKRILKCALLSQKVSLKTAESHGNYEVNL